MDRLKIAVQKSGRLSEKSLNLIEECGIKLTQEGKRKLISVGQNFPIELLFLRDDDIPQYVADRVADIGIVGENEVLEKEKNYALYSIPVLDEKSVLALMESKELGHACERETSVSLVSHPELVHLEKLGDKTFPSRPKPDVDTALTPVDWIAQHPEMAVGIPQKSNKDKGEKILSIWVDKTVEILRKIKKAL